MDKKYYCTSCKNFTSIALKKGNGWIELILYLFYLIPGIIYSIWRRSGEPNVCPICKSDTLIPSSMATIKDNALKREERTCPYCAEVVLIDAKICKHCKSNIELCEDEKTNFKQNLTSFSNNNLQSPTNSNDLKSNRDYTKDFFQENPKLLISLLIIGLILFINMIMK
ncbi:MAG: YqaE/Pmp3 family membrane protein [Sulfuricurvum sp.]|nr:YqaE/Pmp3 family membrane protein [Sulfuricurvum sp.]